MIIDLQTQVGVLTARLNALEAHRHTLVFDNLGYTQQVTTSGICYAPK
jgi:hypothetical protein